MDEDACDLRRPASGDPRRGTARPPARLHADRHAARRRGGRTADRGAGGSDGRVCGPDVGRGGGGVDPALRAHDGVGGRGAVRRARVVRGRPAARRGRRDPVALDDRAGGRRTAQLHVRGRPHHALDAHPARAARAAEGTPRRACRHGDGTARRRRTTDLAARRLRARRRPRRDRLGRCRSRAARRLRPAVRRRPPSGTGRLDTPPRTAREARSAGRPPRDDRDVLDRRWPHPSRSTRLGRARRGDRAEAGRSADGLDRARAAARGAALRRHPDGRGRRRRHSP